VEESSGLQSQESFSWHRYDLSKQQTPCVGRDPAAAEIRHHLACAKALKLKLPTAVFALDRDLRIIVANRAAEELAAAGNCLKNARGKLELRDPGASDALCAAVGGLAAAARDHGTAAGDSFPISRPSLACPYFATAIPIRPLVPIDTCNGACCLLLVEDPDRQDVPPERRLMQLWGLTPAAARAAALWPPVSPRARSPSSSKSASTPCAATCR